MTWTANVSGNWSDALDWSTQREPCADDHTLLPLTNRSVFLQKNQTVRSVMLRGAGAAIRLSPGTSLRVVSHAAAQGLCPQPTNVVVDFVSLSVAAVTWDVVAGAVYSVKNVSF